MEEEMVTITKREYDSLREEADWLECLRAAGVDNWPGIDEAYNISKEEEV